VSTGSDVRAYKERPSPHEGAFKRSEAFLWCPGMVVDTGVARIRHTPEDLFYRQKRCNRIRRPIM